MYPLQSSVIQKKLILPTCLKVCNTVMRGLLLTLAMTANKKELVADLIVKAKQIEYLVNSLPEPEPEEDQVLSRILS